MAAEADPAARPAAAGGVLGIDPGLGATGWGVLKIADDGEARLAWGVVRPPPAARSPLAERLRLLFERISALIERYEPAAMAAESPFVHRNARSAMALGQAQGAALAAGAAAGLAVAEYAPRAIKLAVSGDGDATKADVAEALRRQLRLETLDASPDASDALAVAYCHLLSSRGGARPASTGARR